ncbi:tryptophan halogenase family protein [Novosphingobium pentaromativorans]|uniref:Tryptophan halogenase, putative n=1 Tax=Novosphingobium pentaromativorans US6-1 TaxID=1088721 RepID=G6E7N0_9SPHN|nr:tryptophan halogenase family protein [Novosphingobium pentaromativorans]AIT81578.1 tryptophan halogenase [Novosphingobium pentaromativorans US6-1]EHJ62853.1 tryptophan halogenase, putative [Novosphingobium pentaromativorans US6-1]
MTQTRFSIVIVGGGTAGWMSAAALARFAPPGYAVTLVESEAIGTVGVGEATIPAIRLFNKALGIDEAQFLRETSASYKLGIAFDGWLGEGHSYMHAFGTVGRPLGLLPFRHYWARAKAAGNAKPLAHYAANELAARTGRMATGVSGPGIPELPWAYHFDAGLYATFLRRLAQSMGVTRHEGRIARVIRKDEGDIAAVQTEGGQTLAADFFIDCSGFKGLLIEEELQTGYEDWRHWLPCDRAVAAPCEAAGPFTPYTRSIARSAGWQWRIPLQHRIGNGLVYCSEYLSDEAATESLLASLEAPAQADPRLLRFTTGRRRKAWNRNVLAVGLASGFMEPLESTSIHLIQSTIMRFLTVLPCGPASPAIVSAFNRRTAEEFECIRDFLILHYKANARAGEPFWDRCRDMAVPDSLAARIAEFEEACQIQPAGDELFQEAAWLQVMAGQGIEPKGWNPIADALSEEDLAGFLGAVEQACLQTVGPMPRHMDFLAATCASALSSSPELETLP